MHQAVAVEVGLGAGVHWEVRLEVGLGVTVHRAVPVVVGLRVPSFQRDETICIVIEHDSCVPNDEALPMHVFCFTYSYFVLSVSYMSLTI